MRCVWSKRLSESYAVDIGFNEGIILQYCYKESGIGYSTIQDGAVAALVALGSTATSHKAKYQLENVVLSTI